MANNQLTLCYLTRKPNAIASIANVLRASFPKLTATQAINLEAALAIKGLDIIITDGDIQNINASCPVLFVVPNDKVELYMREPVDFITESESSTHALARAVKNIIERRRLASELKESSIKDELTGLYNQRFLVETLGREIKKATRYGYPLTVLYLGLDGVKDINLKFGHIVGDKVLTDFGLIASHSVREVDTVGRFSGDEFFAILPETNGVNACKVCERMQNATKNFAFANGEPGVNITVSIGIANISSLIRTKEELLAQARTALEGAKRKGPNSVCTFDDAKAVEEPIREKRELIASVRQQILLLTEETRRNYHKNILRLFEDIPLYNKLISHSEHVAFYSNRLALKMGLSSEELSTLKNSALLHDIGKLAIDERIVLKNGPLSSTEYAIMRQHPVLAAQMLSESAFIKNELNTILRHHENFDGSGYPDHMQGTNIPLTARMLALAEAWDTMITSQVYREALQLDQALSELKKGAGRQFDPEIVGMFVGMIES